MRGAFAALLFLSPAGAAETLTLRRAIDETAAQNPDVQSARLRMIEAEAGVETARSQLRPQLNAVVGGTYQTTNLAGIGLAFPGLPSRVGPYRTFNARPVLTQTVIDLSLLSAIRASREQEDQRKWDAEAIREAAQLAVVQLYLQALQSESRIRAAEARIRTAAEILKQARDREQAGTASKLDIARAEQQFQSETAAATNSRRDLRVFKTMLARAIGWDTAKDFSVEEIAPASSVNPDEAAAIGARPELKSLEAGLRSAKFEQERAVRERLPKVSAAGDFGLYGRGLDNSLSTYTVGATLTVPLWTGRRIESQVKAAKARVAQTEQQIRASKLAVKQEVAQAVAEMDAARESLAASTLATEAARKALELAQLRFEGGLGTNLDSVTAQGVLAQSEDAEIRARYEYQLGQARLAHAHGDVKAVAP